MCLTLNQTCNPSLVDPGRVLGRKGKGLMRIIEMNNYYGKEITNTPPKFLNYIYIYNFECGKQAAEAQTRTA